MAFSTPSDEERRSLGGRIQMRRREMFGTKSEAYKAADMNAATWDRIEEGLPVREDRLVAALRVLWPESQGDWLAIGHEKPRGPVFGWSYDDPDYLAHIEGWLTELQGRIETLEAHVAHEGRGQDKNGGQSDAGDAEAQKTQLGGESARPKTMQDYKNERLLAEAQETDAAAYDGGDPDEE